jgi:hypothetical protein
MSYRSFLTLPEIRLLHTAAVRTASAVDRTRRQPIHDDPEDSRISLKARRPFRLGPAEMMNRQHALALSFSSARFMGHAHMRSSDYLGNKLSGCISPTERRIQDGRKGCSCTSINRTIRRRSRLTSRERGPPSSVERRLKSRSTLMAIATSIGPATSCTASQRNQAGRSHYSEDDDTRADALARLPRSLSEALINTKRTNCI